MEERRAVCEEIGSGDEVDEEEGIAGVGRGKKTGVYSVDIAYTETH
jgi:hypothetical protein